MIKMTKIESAGDLPADKTLLVQLNSGNYQVVYIERGTVQDLHGNPKPYMTYGPSKVFSNDEWWSWDNKWGLDEIVSYCIIEESVE